MRANKRWWSVGAAALACALVSCGGQPEERADVGFDDGYAVGYNTACEIRTTLIEGDFDNKTYAQAYARGRAAGEDACRAERAARKSSDALDEVAEEAVSGTTYADQGRPYGCTDDCSGHDAGYEWAQENEVNDPDDCGGNSLSFQEGCRARAEAYQEAREEAMEDEE